MTKGLPLSNRPRPSGPTSVALAARLVLGTVLAVLISGPGTAAFAPPGPPGAPAGVVAQASDPAGEQIGPRLQPVGNGDMIGSPDQAGVGAGPDRGTWWRIVSGAALAVIVLIALIQRRQSPARTRGIGPRRLGRPGGRNPVGR